MSAVNVIRYLLANNAAITALVGTRIYAGVVPQSTVLPAIGINEISAIENTTIDANAAFALVTSRVQVTAITKDYPSQKTLLDTIRKACNYQRGTVSGVVVNQVIRDIVGPDLRDDNAGIFMQSIDFRVIYHESNT